MTYSYVLHEMAQDDFESALQWYLERSRQAATGFVAEVEAALIMICKEPTMWRNTYKHYYELGLKKYPFMLIYFIEPARKLVVVTAVHHNKKNPLNKYRKVGE